MTEAKKPPVKKTPEHPTFAVMVAEAIGSLKEKKGSSRQAISKYICANYRVGPKFAGPLKMALKKGVEQGKLQQTKGVGASGSFKIAKVEVEKKPKKPAAAPKKPKVVAPKKTVAPKSPKKPAKKPVAKKTPTKKAPAKKETAKKAPVKKATKPAPKSPAKKTAAPKSPAKKKTAPKSPVKKGKVAKKAPAKKPAAKKAVKKSK